MHVIMVFQSFIFLKMYRFCALYMYRRVTHKYYSMYTFFDAQLPARSVTHNYCQ